MWKVNLVVTAILGVLHLETPVTCIRGPGPFASLQKTKIVIVGGGVSGIAAATKLLENGISDFVILEAQDYYGGRVHTVSFGNEYVDLGAQWVHGEKGNVVFSMAQPNNLIEEDEFRRAFIEPDGTKLNEDTFDKYINILDEIRDSAYEQLQNYTDSLGRYFNEEFPKKLRENTLSSSSVIEEIFDWYQKDLNVDDGADTWFQTSGRSYTESERLDGFQQWGWKSGGYATVLDLLTKRIPDPSKELPVKDKICYQHEVVKILWKNLQDEHEDKVIVKCKNGAIYVADHVLVTVSLGVLKAKSQDMFEPALSEVKLNTIQGLGYGAVDKIIVEFPSKWWPDNYTQFSILWEGDDACKTKIFGDSKDDLDNCWDHFVYDFNIMRNQPQVLYGWLYGPAARYMEKLSDIEVSGKMVSLIQKFLGAAFNVTLPNPTAILRSEWFSNPHFRGSYSFRSLESEEKGAHASHLAEPVFNENEKLVLMFAGEATHSLHYSTVHGAIESGWREAGRIIKHSK